MNQRMIELYKEASEFAYKICREEGREGGTSDHIWNTLSTGRFAELIVRECATAIINDRRLNDVRSAANGCVRTINEHFGVE